MEDTNKDPGTIISSDENGILIQTKEGVILIKEITLEGGKRSTIDKLLDRNLFIENDEFK